MPKTLKNIISITLLLGFLLPMFSIGLILPQEAYAVDVSSTGVRSVDALTGRACSSWNPLDWINLNCIILNVIWAFDKFLLGTFLSAATAIFDWSVEKNLTGITDSIFVSTGWGIVRDITNLFFIFVLLWIALATIFNIPRYGAKDLLATLIISALLINFSLAIGGFFINFSNSLALAFYNPIKANGSVADQLLAFTNVQTYSTTPTTAQGPEAICDQFARATNPVVAGTPDWQRNYDTNYQTCLDNPETQQIQNQKNAIDPKIEEAIYIALWLIVIIPIIAFVFLAGAVFLLIRYLQLSLLLIFAPIVFFFRVLPDTQYMWSDWWNRLMKQSFFAPAFLFLLFLTITTFNQWSGKTVSSAGNRTGAAPSSQVYATKEPPVLKTAAIGGLGTGLQAQETLAAEPTSGQAPGPKNFFSLGFDMVLFVALMIMNLMVAQQMGIKFAGTVTGWGNRATRWGGRKVRGMAYRQAIRAGTGAARGVTESALGRAMARTPGFRALLTPAVAIQKQREAIDADRAKRVAELAQVSPVAAAERLQGESMAVKAAFAKSASPDAMKKLISQMDAPVQEEFVRQLHQNQDRYRIEDLDKKVGEAMAKDPRGLTLRTVAKTGKRSSDADFQDAINNYLDSLSNRELEDTLTAKAIGENHFAMNYITSRFKDEQRMGRAILGTPEKITAFFDLMRKNLAAASLTDPTLSTRNPIDYFAETMRNQGNAVGANDLTSTPILAVIAGSGAQPFTQRRRRLPVGACCLPTGNCIVTTSADCSAQGGSFMGVGIPCTPGLCTPGTPPAPPATPPTPPTPPGPPPPGTPPTIRTTPPGPTPPTPPGPPTTVPPPPTPPGTPPPIRPAPPRTPPPPPPTTPGPTPPTPPATPGGLPSAATAGLRRRGLPPLPSPPTPPPPAPPPAPSAGLPSALEAALKRRFPPSPESPTMPPTPATPLSKPATPTPTAGTATSPSAPAARTPRQKTAGAPPKADPNDLAAFSRNLAAALNERVANQLTPLVENIDKVNAAVGALSQEVSQGTLNSESGRGAIRTLTQEIKDMRPRGAIQNDNREALTKIIARIRRIEETSRSIAESLSASGENADKETTSLLRGLHDASQLTRLALARKREILSS